MRCSGRSGRRSCGWGTGGSRSWRCAARRRRFGRQAQAAQRRPRAAGGAFQDGPQRRLAAAARA
jgi:hypothetical protein